MYESGGYPLDAATALFGIEIGGVSTAPDGCRSDIQNRAQAIIKKGSTIP
jgi:hypothetical protein